MAMEDSLPDPEAKATVEAERTRGGTYYRPQVDIQEHKDELTVLVDMPGSGSDQIEVRFEEGTLAIHGKVAPRQAEEPAYLVREYGVGDYYRSFQISEAIDASRISAEYADGVLTLHLPKVEAVKPRRIEVKQA